MPKRLAIHAIVRLCAAIDYIPALRRREDTGCLRLTHSCWGCWPLRLSHTAVVLDERWGTGVWGAP